MWVTLATLCALLLLQVEVGCAPEEGELLKLQWGAKGTRLHASARRLLQEEPPPPLPEPSASSSPLSQPPAPAGPIPPFPHHPPPPPLPQGEYPLPDNLPPVNRNRPQAARVNATLRFTFVQQYQTDQEFRSHTQVWVRYYLATAVAGTKDRESELENVYVGVTDARITSATGGGLVIRMDLLVELYNFTQAEEVLDRFAPILRRTTVCGFDQCDVFTHPYFEPFRDISFLEAPTIEKFDQPDFLQPPSELDPASVLGLDAGALMAALGLAGVSLLAVGCVGCYLRFCAEDPPRDEEEPLAPQGGTEGYNPAFQHEEDLGEGEPVENGNGSGSGNGEVELVEQAPRSARMLWRGGEKKAANMGLASEAFASAGAVWKKPEKRRLSLMSEATFVKSKTIGDKRV